MSIDTFSVLLVLLSMYLIIGAMAQVFIEHIFENHVDWVTLIKTDDNYKNQFQVLVQKEFKITPDYIEINHSLEYGYEMGVYICLGQEKYETTLNKAVNFKDIKL